MQVRCPEEGMTVVFNSLLNASVEEAQTTGVVCKVVKVNQEAFCRTYDLQLQNSRVNIPKVSMDFIYPAHVVSPTTEAAEVEAQTEQQSSTEETSILPVARKAPKVFGAEVKKVNVNAVSNREEKEVKLEKKRKKNKRKKK